MFSNYLKWEHRMINFAVLEGYTSSCETLDWVSEYTCVIERTATSLDFVLYEISRIVAYGQGNSKMTMSFSEGDEAFLFYPWPSPESSSCTGSECTVQYAENPTLLANRMASASVFGASDDIVLETSGGLKLTSFRKKSSNITLYLTAKLREAKNLSRSPKLRIN